MLTFDRLLHENILLVGDFNLTPKSPKVNELIEEHEFVIVISEQTCFKSINITCIDNFLTNVKTREKNSYI